MNIYCDATDGTVIRKLLGERKRRYKKVLLKQIKLLKSGRISEKEFYEKYKAMKNHLSHGNCYKLTCDLDKFVNGKIQEIEA